MAINQSIKDSINQMFGVKIGVDMPEPSVVYSDAEPPKKVYGSLEPEHIQGILEELRGWYLDQFPDLRNWIDRLTGREAKWTVRSNQIPEQLQDLAEKVKSTFAREKSSITTLGQYSAKKNQITIYNRAFDPSDPVRCAAKMRMTLAHETFHALHHHLAPTTYSEKTYATVAVKEGLADFYAYLFCLDANAAKADGVDFAVSCDVADDRYGFWDKNIFNDIPYHNAIFHMYRGGVIYHDDTYSDCDANGDVSKMKDVLDRSKADMLDAYETLVPPEYRMNNNPLKTVHPRADGKYVVVKVLLSQKKNLRYSFLFDPDDPGMVYVGDLVTVSTPFGLKDVPVEEVYEWTQAEYDAECARIGYEDLGIAVKA